MINLLITIIIIFLLLMIWIFVQQVARKFAANHPELGPVKEEGLGCGKTCGCKKGYCNAKD
ncbi:MAG: hypothetical protein HFP81_03760 [Methylococcales symbiont of Hymedesmia sp. n. MRB-2018]|nr:MAG: hypothetical protein HFP78_04820 [Methylococcales symbiont of Hymedesmia sp. n. MRB-2018]KAF3984166.1 MAG: hypothetical protein HFP81_03760 [Methylococcales symbiont of Hymedesmia sp. n. MRB-2018]